MNEENNPIIINTTEGKDARDAARKAGPVAPESMKANADLAAAENDAAASFKDDEEAAKVKAAAIDEMEKASQKALDAMRENDNAENSEIVDEAEEKLDTIFDDFRKWIDENTNPDKVKENLDKLKNDTANLLNTTREKVIETAESEQFKDTMKAGKDFVTGTAGMIGDGFKYGYEKLMEIPEFKQVASKVDEGIDKLRHSESLRNLASAAEKGAADFNNAIFKGINSFFSTSSETREEDLPETPDKAGKTDQQ